MADALVYGVTLENVSVSTARTLIQVKAGTTRRVRLLRAVIAQNDSEVSEQLRIALLLKTVAATVTAYTARPYRNGAPAADAVGGTSATGTNASAEGTDGNILVVEGFNTLSGWTWLPTPKEQIEINSGDVIGMVLLTAPSAALNMDGYLVFEEF